MNGSRFNYEDYAYEPPVDERRGGDYYLAATPVPAPVAPAPRLAADIHVAPVESILHRPVGELIENSVLSKPVSEVLSSAVRKRRLAG